MPSRHSDTLASTPPGGDFKALFRIVVIIADALEHDEPEELDNL
jgi:hypothetical protein